jgi:hypothetical protein
MTKHIVFLASAAILAALPAPRAYADYAILSPSGAALAPDAAKLDLELTAGGAPMRETRATFGAPIAEIEIAELEKPGMAAGSFSVESQLLPETSKLPSLAAGIRDIGNDTYSYAASGYHGRSFYLAGARTPVQYAGASCPLRNLSYTLGCGLAGIQGPFGSVSADLPLRLRWTAEWDSHNFNERLALSLTNYASIQYERQASSNFVGLAIFTPVTVF